ncbi:hypothetical protein ASPZODRAFT_17656 [Penicilliopsis zonata CBS 506.65]|uniref:Uncharacterized protein n=1 Tax=Penicilliopsis zonata CBS 506.65 TaxID=1073090 RepID=A0A1L9SE28_9EURO|nr:hypothetical protein ASPZODRAFT_17656 [Penicilliopsis zonata CBS 506.65]OJJ45439.1 hypothetical protein ASPZODRAFT_17656 [Penicilliopsis zonata CBS 506.65]
MAEYGHPVHAGFLKQQPSDLDDSSFLPLWARSKVRYAQNLLACSDEPIEYDHDDEDYRDNCFFFPEDCSWSPPRGWLAHENLSLEDLTDSSDEDDTMAPSLPDIKMLDSEALGDLLEDNLSPPEITSIIVFATNGAIFAYASSLPARQLRNLSATYGAAYTCYAKNVSSGNLTGVDPTSHPSSYVTAQSVSLGDVGSIVFELEGQVAVVTRLADKVLLAAVGPCKLPDASIDDPAGPRLETDASSPASSAEGNHQVNGNGTTTMTTTTTSTPSTTTHDTLLQTQYEIDRSTDLARLASLNLSASPAILLALESKSAALGRFLGQKLADLESPEDF